MKNADPLARESLDGTLFAPPTPVNVPARQAHRPMAETSLAARAEQVSKPNKHYASILRSLAQEPMTHKEWCKATGAETNTSGRFTELSSVGLIIATGKRDGANVWSLSAKALDLIKLSDDEISSRVRELLAEKKAA